MARKKTTNKRPRPAIRSHSDHDTDEHNNSSHSSDNLPLLNNIERNSVNVNDEPTRSIAESMPNFNCDVAVNVTRLSKNLTRMLDKHNLCAIYDSRTRKAVVTKPKANKKKAKYKVLKHLIRILLIPVSKKHFPLTD